MFSVVISSRCLAYCVAVMWRFNCLVAQTIAVYVYHNFISELVEAEAKVKLRPRRSRSELVEAKAKVLITMISYECRCSLTSFYPML